MAMRRGLSFARHRNRSRRWCALEQLEPRRVLATITVTSLADGVIDDGAVTLREALLAAESNTSIDGSAAGDELVTDRIVFDSALAGGAIDLVESDSGSALSINSDLIIEGSNITLQRSTSDLFRILEVGDAQT